MKAYQQNDAAKLTNVVREETPAYESREALEEARLREAVNRPDKEKFLLFTKMMRIGMMLKKANIRHKP